MKHLVILLVTATLAAICLAGEAPTNSQIVDNVTSLGYRIEVHSVTSADNYRLSMWQISAANATSPAGPVLLQHGLFDSGATWIINTPSNSLVFALADAGFDVFVPTSRGSWFSMPGAQAAEAASDWDFDWDQMAQFDLPACVDRALSVTGAASLPVVSHSQGTLVTFAAFTYAPKLCSKVSRFIALAPPLSLANQRSILLKVMAKLHFELALQALDSATDKPFLLSLDLLRHVLGSAMVPADSLLSALFGPTDNLDEERVKTVYSNFFPAPTSVRNVAHWMQMFRSGAFQHYDTSIFSKAKLYDLNTARVPTTIMYGTNDDVATRADIQAGLALLQPATRARFFNDVREVPGYAHMDFVWGVACGADINAPILELLRT